ncbi:helix-turn-helix domain-containing protein [Macrococcus equipercicus]|uniref:Tetratricopeptide repeat protein n=1 Tax=Macrococcus equipercicus TaxID=69967 RepID=A0A9Q9BU78_9STAP|nr:helix-turn-helix domain-containing protein [Macrococcus equipercicus]UTH14166.1 tetratricopeptide repeat protein [Macrococcus equipercicus]
MLGQRVKELRNAANLTQQQLAEGIISRTYLSLIEKNSVHPSTNVLKKLSVRLNCTLDDFTATSADRNLSLLDIKKDIKWAENHVMLHEFNKLEDFLAKNYETLESITEYERGAVHWIKASYYFHQKNYAKTREELDAAISIVKKLKDVTIYLRALVLLGRVEQRTDNIMEAIHQLTIANNITIFENITNTSRVTILGSLGEYYRLIGENYVALNLCEDALSLSSRLNTYHFGFEIENTMGKAYHVLKNYDKAEVHVRRAIAYAELKGPSLELVGARTNLAILLMEVGRLDEAYDNIKIAFEMIGENGYDVPFVMNVRLRYGQILSKLGRIDEAKALVKEQTDKDEAGFANEIMGDISVKEGNLQGALTYYLEALKGDDLPIYMVQLRPKVADIYKQLGQTDKAMEHYEKSITEYKSLVNDML